jgi:hypothetical protein
MEQVLDKLIAEMEHLRQTLSEDGGIADIVDVTAETKFDDPGLVTIDEYPYLFVSPISEAPNFETLGRVGYDVRTLTVLVGLVLNASDYFDPSVSETPGTRVLVQAMSKIRAHLRRLAKRNLDFTAGQVRNVVVQSTNYVPDLRGDAFVRMAVTTLVLDKQYQHEA